jgi:hypothetical protein
VQEGTQAVLSTIKPEPAEQDAPAKTSQELRTKLDRSAIVSINAGGRDMGKWQVTVIPDTPPTVSMPSYRANTHRRLCRAMEGF